MTPRRPPQHPLRAAASMFGYVGFFSVLFFGLVATLLLARFGFRLVGPVRAAALLWTIVLLPSAALASLAALGAYRLHQERNRVLNNQCIGCGYDLAMSPHRCPECGRPARPRRRV